MKPSPRNCRNRQGMTLIELMVSIIVIGIAIAGLTEMLWVNATWSTRLLNKTDNISEAKQSLERIGQDVRLSRCVGDGISGSILFSKGAKNYALDASTLIVQVPLFDSAGFPSKTSTACDVDTIVYQVSPDTRDTSNSTFQITKSIFRGINDAGLGDTVDQIVQNGVIGPLDRITNKPAVFEYISTSGSSISSVDLTPQTASTVSGVVVNLEVNKTEASPTQINVNATNRSTVVLKTEMFMRNYLTELSR